MGSGFFIKPSGRILGGITASSSSTSAVLLTVPGITRRSPSGIMLGSSIPLALTSSSTVVPYSRAIFESVSPFLIRYTSAGAVRDCVTPAASRAIEACSALSVALAKGSFKASLVTEGVAGMSILSKYCSTASSDTSGSCTSYFLGLTFLGSTTSGVRPTIDLMKDSTKPSSALGFVSTPMIPVSLGASVVSGDSLSASFKASWMLGADPENRLAIISNPCSNTYIISY